MKRVSRDHVVSPGARFTKILADLEARLHRLQPPDDLARATFLHVNAAAVWIWLQEAVCACAGRAPDVLNCKSAEG
jgi:hypothetical protein